MSINPQFRDSVNFRDLGGYQSADGRRIKPGLLYRSGGIYLMNPEELSHLSSLGIKSVMDLRTRVESEAHPDPELEGVEFIRHSGLTFRGGEEIDFSPTGMHRLGEHAENQVNAIYSYYGEIPFDNEAMRILMGKIAEGATPIVFHCATGKDRTGIAAMILLTALGVPYETVLKDYLLSNDYHHEGLNTLLEENREKLKAHPEMRELVQIWGGVTETAGRGALDGIYNRYGSPEEYLLREFNLGPAELTALRDMYLE